MAERSSAAASSEGLSSSPVSGPRASATRAWAMPTSRSGVQGLLKAEVVKVIEELGPAFSPVWSSGELKQIIKDNLFPRNEAEAQGAVKGISSMKKAERIGAATGVGAHIAPNIASAALELAMRKAVLQKTAPEPTDYMGFGKRGAMTYQQVLIQFPSSYAKWAKKEANSESSWELVRFVSWLNETGVVQLQKQMAKDHVDVP
eukprot:3257185-Pyramimonas_sp.AAC.1